MTLKNFISFDWAMKRLLRSKANFGILEGFLSELLKRDIKILQLLESESNQENELDKQNRVDIMVKDDNGEIILIEVQACTELDYLQRMLYGTSKVIAEYLHRGDKYSQVKKVYSVNILYFDLGQGEDYIYHGTTNFLGLHKNDQLQLSEKQKEMYQKELVHQLYPEYYLIKVNQFNDVAKDTLDEWIYFLKNDDIKKTFKAKGLLEAREKLTTMQLTGDEALKYKKYLEDLHFQASMAETVNALSYDKGKAEGKLETARKMKKLGATVEFISQATELTAEEVDKL